MESGEEERCPQPGRTPGHRTSQGLHRYLRRGRRELRDRCDGSAGPRVWRAIRAQPRAHHGEYQRLWRDRALRELHGLWPRHPALDRTDHGDRLCWRGARRDGGFHARPDRGYHHGFRGLRRPRETPGERSRRSSGCFALGSDRGFFRRGLDGSRDERGGAYAPGEPGSRHVTPWILPDPGRRRLDFHCMRVGRAVASPFGRACTRVGRRPSIPAPFGSQTERERTRGGTGGPNA